MTNLTQSKLAAQGVVIQRKKIATGDYDADETEVLRAMCDYTQAQIESRKLGGKAKSPAKTEANRRNASRPRRRKPRCLCGRMTADAARKSSHVCPLEAFTDSL